MNLLQIISCHTYKGSDGEERIVMRVEDGFVTYESNKGGLMPEVISLEDFTKWAVEDVTPSLFDLLK